MIKRELSVLGRGSEIQLKLDTMLNYKSFDITDKSKPSLLKKAGGAAVGAVAGNKLGGKVDLAIGNDSDKYKKIGTGLGAITGYWAAGRK
jgi:outer membrane lipoprotein SlyB